MIPLYQPDPDDNTVRKNVRGRAVTGILLDLLHELGFDFLSPGNLVVKIPGLARIVLKGLVGHTSFVR